MEAAVALYFQFQLLIFWWFLHCGVASLVICIRQVFFAYAAAAACTLEAGIPQISNTMYKQNGF